MGQTEGTLCPHCGSADRQVGAGLDRSGSRRRLCRRCGRTCTPEARALGRGAEKRREALKCYAAYWPVSEIARALGVSRQTVSNWVKAACGSEGRLTAAGDADVLLRAAAFRRETEMDRRRPRVGAGRRRGRE